jgi:glycosyltransferase involved in cell wall biosynthesis
LRVLWFANTPCNAVEHLGGETIGGGWLQALDIHMQEKVELHVAFYMNWKERMFTSRKSTYHVIPARSIRMSNIRNILYPHIIHLEDTSCYLEIIERVRPDIIHIHGTENAYGTFVEKVDIPVVCSIQGILTPYAFKTGIEAYDELNAHVGRSCKGLRSMLFEKGHKHQYRQMQLMAAREARYIRHIKNFIGRTQWDRNVSSVMSPGSRYFTGDEIMREVFYYAKWNHPGDKGCRIIHTTTSDNLIKGFSALVEALNVLLAAGVEVEWRVAGLTEASSVVKIARKIMGRKYPSHALRLLGRIGAEELAARMNEAHVFVLPSYIENSPNSLCEAMMMGMPCIATNGGGTPSMIHDGVEGMLVQSRDPWAMAGAVMEMFNDTAGAIGRGQAARCRALVRHDPLRIVDQVYGVYQNILGQ